MEASRNPIMIRPLEGFRLMVALAVALVVSMSATTAAEVAKEIRSIYRGNGTWTVSFGPGPNLEIKSKAPGIRGFRFDLKIWSRPEGYSPSSISPVYRPDFFGNFCCCRRGHRYNQRNCQRYHKPEPFKGADHDWVPRSFHVLSTE